MQKTLKAIVIKNSDVKEKDKSILLFSVEEGKLWATLRGVRSDKAKLKFAKEPFCFGEYTIESGINNVVTAVSIIESFSNLSKDVQKYYEACALLEIVDKLSFDAERVQLFLALVKGLKAICYSNVDQNIVLTKFLLDTFEFFGMKIYSPVCTCCKAPFHDHIFLNLDIGELTCQRCKPFNACEVTFAEFQLIKILSACEYDKLETLHFNQETITSAIKLLSKNFSCRFERQLKLIGII